MNTLRQHLVIEDEVVRVLRQGQFGENLAAEATITGVILRQLYAQEQILKGRQQAVGKVLVEGHAAAQRRASNNARTQHHVIDVIGHHACHCGHQ